MAQISEDYCSFETAKLLKEKEFDAPVKNYYSIYIEDAKYNLQKKYGAKKNWNSLALSISRPSQSLVMKWLREVHHLTIDIFHFREWKVNIKTTDDYLKADYDNPELKPSETYEEACEAAIRYCLEKLI